MDSKMVPKTYRFPPKLVQRIEKEGLMRRAVPTDVIRVALHWYFQQDAAEREIYWSKLRAEAEDSPL